MAGLQRSSETFRRSGSSGLVWEDRFLSEDPMKQTKKPSKAEGGGLELRHSRSTGSLHMQGGGGRHGHSTVHVSPVVDPPSPKISGCGFCAVFRKADSMERRRTKSKRTGHR